MRSIPSVLIATFVLFGSAAIAQVGSAFTASVSTSLVTVSVAPSPATVPYGRTLQFTATVAGTTNTGVHWTVNGDNGGNKKVGTISGAGLYKAPTQGDNPTTASVTVAAMSNADPTKSAEATVIFTTGVSVAITPSSASVQIRGTQQFSASVTGSSNTAVAWTVNGVAGGNLTVGTISGSGLYTAPSAVPAGTITVKAISAADSSKSAQASVTVLPPVSVSLTPTTASVPVGQTQLFAATVTGTSNTAVTWTVNGITGGNSILGTISSSGLYSAPSVAPPGTIAIAAISVVDPTKSAKAAVTVTAPVAVVVSISPTTASLSPGQTKQFTASVTGTSNTAVAWNVNGIAGGGSTVGSITSSGLYTAPQNGGMSVTVNALSVADSTKSAQVVVTVMSPVTVSVAPGAATMLPSQTQPFTAAVAGTTNTGVTWSITPPTGTISFSGVYTAPATIAVSNSITATATSTADPTKSGSATINLMPPLIITTTTLPGGTAGTAYSAAAAAMGGVTPYTWSIASGQLPPGLSLDSASGAISGTPSSAGPYTITVKATDAAAYQATAAFVLVIAVAACTSCPGALQVTTTTLPSGSVGSAYSATLASTGGTSPYSWSISTGQLPLGLTFNSAMGAISGTPSTAGSYNFTALVADSTSPPKTASQALTINVSVSPAMDQYGGLLAVQSASPAGNWHTEKIGNRWWIITPQGHGMHVSSIYKTNADAAGTSPAGTNFRDVINSKYGSTVFYPCNYLPTIASRMQAWGFNTIGISSDSNLWAWQQITCWPYDSSLGGYYMPQQYRKPFILQIPTSTYSESNLTAGYVGGQPCTYAVSPLDEPVKNFNYGINSRLGYGGWLTSREADYWDKRIYDYFNYQITNSLGQYCFAPDAVKSYLMGVSTDEGDELFSFTVWHGPVLNNNEHSHGALRVLRTSPVQSSDFLKQSLYADAGLYIKAMGLRNYLKSKYGTIAALNTAWGSSYQACDMEGAGDEFGSCGTKISGEAFATANGSSSTYTHGLMHLTPSWHSVQIAVNGAVVAGDTGYCAFSGCDTNGVYADPSRPPAGPAKFYGPLVDMADSTINYSTGAAAIAFKTGSSKIVSIHGDGSTVTVRVGTDSVWGQSQHGTWPGAHITISGTVNYNVTGAVVASVVDGTTLTITSRATGATELSTGTASFTDAAPPSGAAITVSYVQNGWGTGNGLMDEDGRHSACLGATNSETNAINLNLCNDTTAGLYANPNIRTDLDAFVGAMLQQYLSNLNTKFSAVFGSGSSRKLINFGPDIMFSNAVLPTAEMIQAASDNTDIIEFQFANSVTSLDQTAMNFIGQHSTKPLMDVMFSQANPDSALRGFVGEGGGQVFSTQADRGAGYVARINSLLSLSYPDGTKPWAAFGWWQWSDAIDNNNSNYGLVTPYDNAYDGHEATTATVTCSPSTPSVCGPNHNQPCTCGGANAEQYTSGDFITSVKSGNALWSLVK